MIEPVIEWRCSECGRMVPEDQHIGSYSMKAALMFANIHVREPDKTPSRRWHTVYKWDRHYHARDCGPIVQRAVHPNELFLEWDPHET